MKPKLLILLAAILTLAPVVARAGDSLSELKERFKERYPHLVELKRAGAVGETATGMVDFVQPGSGDPEARQFVQTENRDRAALYKLIAAKDGTTPEKVAEINARRRFEKAKPGEWLRAADGKWNKKEN